MRLVIWRTQLGILLAALLLTAGCLETTLMGIGGMAAVGGYKWVEGTMERDYPRPMPEVWKATLEACKDLRLQIKKKQEYNPVESHIEAVSPPNTNVKIQLIARPNQITTVVPATASRVTRTPRLTSTGALRSTWACLRSNGGEDR